MISTEGGVAALKREETNELGKKLKKYFDADLLAYKRGIIKLETQ